MTVCLDTKKNKTIKKEIKMKNIPIANTISDILQGESPKNTQKAKVTKSKGYTSLTRKTINNIVFILPENRKEFTMINGDIVDSWSEEFALIAREDHEAYTLERHYRTVSFSIFESLIKWAGYKKKDYKVWTELINIIDSNEDQNGYNHNYDGNKIPIEDIPIGASIRYTKYSDVQIPSSWHLPASMLISIKHKKTGKIIKALAGMDGYEYFLCVLDSNRVASVDTAFRSLTPTSIKKILKEGKAVFRQGEWYFHEHFQSGSFEAIQFYKTMIPNFVLPKDHSDSNSHSCTKGLKTTNGLFASGHVRHPEHKTITLNYCSPTNNISIYKVEKNTAIMSWGAKYKVD